ncbi:DUF4224 domain-containing protein [Chromobacterium haemolyticum]|uniref:DUF4224 domain-containing protein n=1 Tax=Chromobacterium haemolyticum TaxID=394935 RepID=UPI000DEECB8D|nr:DUF4224 domain-containing protein [Chromobacterium haemolyticum]
MALQSETLTSEELTVITGGTRRREQVNWLKSNHWVYHTTRAGYPVVGRLYARLKLSGINPAKLAGPEQWTPDLDSVR